MKAVITLSDLPPNSPARIGFSVRCHRADGDVGITHAGSLAHQLKETLQHIAVETDCLDASVTADRLIDWQEAAWLLWSDVIQSRAGFPLPIEQQPARWRRQAVMDWIRVNRPRRIDWDMAQGFIRRPAIKAGNPHA